MNELIERIIPRLSDDERKVLSLPTIQLSMLGGTKGITIEKHHKIALATYRSLVARGIAKASRHPSSGIMPLTEFGEKVVERLGPSTADPVWPCGHPRTPENTQRVGVAGDRCRTCRNEMHRRLRQNGGREHQYHQCPGDKPECFEGRCVYCSGGLSFCIVCKKGEGELEATCPGSLDD